MAEVQTDRVEDDAGGTRWGSGELRIEHVEVLGPDGRSTSRLHTGEKVTIRLHYDARETVDQPVFGVAVHTLEGILVTGPNTRQAGVDFGQLKGTGHVDLTVDRFLLLPGAYDITVSAYDHHVIHPFDFRQNVLRVDVDPASPTRPSAGSCHTGWPVGERCRRQRARRRLIGAASPADLRSPGGSPPIPRPRRRLLGTRRACGRAMLQRRGRAM